MTAEQKKQAKLTVLRLLAASPKSKNDLEKKLKSKGYGTPVIQEVLAELEEVGILDDKQYAQNLYQKFTEFKPSGHRKISFELKKRGISKKVCHEVLEQDNKEDEFQRAQILAQERWEKFRNLPLDKRQKRTYDYLMRRGFDYGQCKSAIDEIKRLESHEDE